MSDTIVPQSCIGFTDLPCEIRSMIWLLCLPNPRVLTLRFHSNLQSRNPQPTLLHINQESRAHLLRTYKLIRTASSQFAFHPLKDSIYLIDKRMGTPYRGGNHQAIKFCSAITNTTLICTDLEELKITKVVITENDIIENDPEDPVSWGPLGPRSRLRRLFLTLVSEVTIVVVNEDLPLAVLPGDYGARSYRYHPRHFMGCLRDEMHDPELSGAGLKMPVVRIVGRQVWTMEDPYCTEMLAPKKAVGIPLAVRTVKRFFTKPGRRV